MNTLKSFPFGLMTVLMLAIFTVSCEREAINPEISSDASIENTIDVKAKLPVEVDKQLSTIKSNLKKYTGETFKLINHTAINKNEMATKLSLIEASGEEGVAYGNIAAPSTLVFYKMNELSALTRQTVSKDLNTYKAELIKPSDDIIELTWEAKGKEFKSLCHYNNEGIVWDNVIFGLFEAAPEGQELKETRTSKSLVEEDWYKRWWTVNWIWGK